MLLFTEDADLCCAAHVATLQERLQCVINMLSRQSSSLEVQANSHADTRASCFSYNPADIKHKQIWSKVHMPALAKTIHICNEHNRRQLAQDELCMKLSS